MPKPQKPEQLVLRIAKWKVGTVTRKSMKFADCLIKRRKVCVCCLQEAHWKRTQAKQIGYRFKLFLGRESYLGRGIVQRV